MMKKFKVIAALSLVLVFLASCSTSKEARTFKKSIDGNWQLQTVVSEGIMGKVKARIFNEEDFNCFVGSTWSFNKRNNLGSYTISTNGAECVAVKRDIRWSVYEAAGEPKLFQFKRLDSKLKEIDENSAGFRFTIVQLNDNAMQLKSDITFEGKPASFIYNFVRI